MNSKDGNPIIRCNKALDFARQAVALSRSLGLQLLLGECLLAESQALVMIPDKERRKAAKQVLVETLSLFKVDIHPLYWAKAKLLYARTYGNRDTTRVPYLHEALSIYRKLTYKPGIVETLATLGETARLVGKYQYGISIQMERLALQQSMPDQDIASTLSRISTLYEELGNMPKALAYAQQGYLEAKKRKDPFRIAMSNQNIGIIYSAIGDHEMAIQYFRTGLQIFQANQYYDPAVRIWLHMVIRLRTLGRYQEALLEAKAALKLAETKAKAYEYNAVLSLAKCYIALGDYVIAERYCLRLLPLYPELSEGKAETLQALGDVYFGKKQWAKSEFYSKASFSLREKIGNQPHLQREVLQQLYRIDSARGNYQSAFSYYQMYTAMNDSLLNAEKNKQIAFMQVQFDTEKKEQDIRLLRQDQAISRGRFQLTIGGAILLMLLLGLTYNRYRLKQRSNLQLETKQLLIDQKNQSLQQLLEEREWMLKEIHHRVKNNLQVISSMLNAQFNFLQDPSALAAIRESQNRVQVMALIHQKLYQSDNLAQIGMQEYIHEIVDYLIESFDRFDTVRAQVSIADVHFDVSLATPLGLIINEALTNSLKYAFPHNRRGEVAIQLRQIDEQTYQLTIRDDGVGLPDGFDASRSKTLGMTMIRGLSKQIKGKLDITQCNGVEISLQFTVVKKKVRTGSLTAKAEG
ncbi:tetratricopeptide repeat-containing sensor histidine kinase [Fibrisoma limi]|nr:histidine kinase dimerization/phosphoacceptor domain -containing protein [Fibrisoma limi]